MKINGITENARDFALRYGPQRCAFVGTAGLTGCKQYLIPVRTPNDGEPVKDENWGVRPSQSQRPIIQANNDPSPGLIIRLSAFSKSGKAFGRINCPTDKASDLIVVAYGTAGLEDGTRWEEAILKVTAPCAFVIHHTGMNDEMVVVDDTFEVEREILKDGYFGGYANISHPMFRRWKAE